MFHYYPGTLSEIPCTYSSKLGAVFLSPYVSSLSVSSSSNFWLSERSSLDIRNPQSFFYMWSLYFSVIIRGDQRLASFQKCSHHTHPFFSDRQPPSYDGCLEVRGEIIRTVLCCIVYWSCAQSWAHLDEQVLQFSELSFVSLGPSHCASIHCVYGCVFLCYLVMDLAQLKPNPWTSFFSALTLLVGSFDP